MAVFGILAVLFTGFYVVSFLWITDGVTLGPGDKAGALVMWWLIVPYLSWSGVIIAKWALK